MKKNGLALVVLVIMCFGYSCTRDKALVPVVTDCSRVDSVKNVYSPQIETIVGLNCYAGCHDPDHAALNGGVDFSDYNTTKTAFQTKNVICAVKGTDCIPMPYQRDKLADSLISILECWQSRGYPQ